MAKRRLRSSSGRRTAKSTPPRGRLYEPEAERCTWSSPSTLGVKNLTSQPIPVLDAETAALLGAYGKFTEMRKDRDDWQLRWQICNGCRNVYRQILKRALHDLLGFYDRVEAGHDHNGWSIHEILRIGEIRKLAK